MENIRNKIHIRLYAFFCIIATVIVFIIGFMLLRFPDNAGKGVTSGIEICMFTLLPSMFPFMFLVNILIETGLLEKGEKIWLPITEKIFRLPGICGPVIFFSMIGGLPLGGKMTEDLYNKGYISIKQGQRMLFFCMNPGPSFVITTVGYYMLGSNQVGIMLYASVVLSSMIIGVLSSFIWSDAVTVKRINVKSVKPELKNAIIDSASKSGRSMFNICVWVVLFSCFAELVELLPLEDATKTFISCVSEITNGCRKSANLYPLPLIAGIIGFSGFCAHMQIMPAIMKLRLGMKYFLSARIINAALSVLIFKFLAELFPISVQTVALGSVPQKSGIELSLPICIGIIMMSILLLLGDNYRVKKAGNK